MSDTDWGDGVPPALATRMTGLLRAHGADDHSPAALLGSASRALDELIARAPADQSALDLLAIDGLVTAAFVTLQSPTELEALAEEATMKLMALGKHSS